MVFECEFKFQFKVPMWEYDDVTLKCVVWKPDTSSAHRLEKETCFEQLNAQNK